MSNRNYSYRVSNAKGITLPAGVEIICTAKQWERIKEFCVGKQSRAQLTASVMFKYGEVITLPVPIRKDLVADGTEALETGLTFAEIQRAQRQETKLAEEAGAA